MKDLEKLRTFLYDLDRIRNDAEAVHKLIMEYTVTTSDLKESEGIDVMVEICDVDNDDLKFRMTVDGEYDSLWFCIDASDAELKRIKRKIGDIILNTRI